MSFNSLKSYLSNWVDLPENDWLFFSERLVEQNYKHKALLTSKGAIEKQLSFIASGVVRYYYENLENDITFGFSFPNSFASAYDSFIQQSPSSYAIQAITPVTVWSISYCNLQEVYQQTVIGNTIGRLAGEMLFLNKIKREKSLLILTAEERYLELFTERPELIKHIPLKYIASYIGVTPQALSRIRKRIS